MENKTKLYSQPGCGTCISTERYMKTNNIPHVKIDITLDEDAHRHVTKTLGYAGVPVVETPSGEHWKGLNMTKLKELAAEYEQN